MKAFNYLFSNEENLHLLAANSRKVFGSAAFGLSLQYIIKYLEGDRSDEVYIVFFAALLHKAKKISPIETYAFDNLARRGNILDLDKFKYSFDTSRLDKEGKYLLMLLEEFPQKNVDYNKNGVHYMGTLMNGFDSLPKCEDANMQSVLKEINDAYNDYF